MDILHWVIMWLSSTIILLSVVRVVESGLTFIKKKYGETGLYVTVTASIMILFVTYIAMAVMVGVPQ